MSRKDEQLSQLVDVYRDVLIATPSRGALDRSIKLIESVSRLRIATPETEDALKELDEEAAKAERIQQQFGDHLQEFMQAEFEAGQLRRRRKTEFLQFQQLVLRTMRALVLPDFLQHLDHPLSDARFSLALDTGLVIFHQAYFGLLQDLPSELKQERTALVQSMGRLANCVTTPADYHRLWALICDAEDEPNLAENHYRQALDHTAPKSHEYMTLLQAGWSQLIERQLFSRAMLLLLSNAARVPQNHHEEFNELAAVTLEMKRAA